MNYSQEGGKMGYKYEWFNYIVASVDILGQKSAFKEIKDKLILEVSPAKLQEISEKTIDIVERFRKSFFNYYKRYLRKTEVSEEYKAEYEKMIKEQEIKLKFFSDTIIISLAIKPNKFQAINIIHIPAILTSIGGMLLSMLYDRHSFRAGIELGIATELENKELENKDIYGPALIKAYCLENRIAKYPRIVIGSNLIEYLKFLSEGNPIINNQIKMDIERCKKIAKSCLSMIDTDFDGYPIFDYLGENFRNKILSKIEISQEIISGAYDFVKREHEYRKNSVQNEENKKLALKYLRLLNYFEKRL
ncbi:MAG: hypothetical protein GF421_02465 [Candidatus Aminicenantes bacterium]|nr:hypothetical protein [Candidatus Aminicenantes bacterium]